MDNLNLLNYDIDECAQLYMRDIKKFTSLKKEEEHKLINAYKNNNDFDARNKLITSNLKYTCKLANKYRNRGIPFSVLISEANDGLMYAIEKFDTSNDVKLMSYARSWIEEYLRRITEKNVESLEIPLPSEKCDQLLDDNTDYAQEYSMEDDYCNAAFVEDEKMEEANDAKNLIMHLCSVLDDREIQIIGMKYGLYPYEKESTLDDIGKELELTKERVRQILEKAKTKMRSQAMLIECNFLAK